MPQKASWKYFKGSAEPSATVGAWRLNGFSETGWLVANAPFYYGETFASGTIISGMQNTFSTLYFRKTVNVADPSALDRVVLRVLIDDGYIVWINGKEAVRYNVSVQEPTHTDFAAAVIEQTWTTNTVVASDFLVAGTNTVAVQVLNANLTSSDIVFDLQLDSSSDKVAPTVASVSPAPGQLSQLTSITVNFSEAVQGVSAADFLLNGTAATSVSGSGATYTFAFAQPPFGTVNVSWEPGHQIGDLAVPPNAFDSTAASAQWSYNLRDVTAPTVASLNPPNGARVKALSQVDVRFSETVVGVDAADLLINGAPAMNVVANGTLYSFQFPAQGPGAVAVTWAAGHGIADVAVPANAFVAQNYSYTVDPNYTPPTVIISEFLAAAQAATGLKDEDGELQDWIEVYNATASPVNLENWSLTDDPENPDLWLFPNVTLAAGGRTVVFASAKDRRPTTGNLHTNFKLNNAGEFLGLFNPESPRRAMTALNFPEQRNDYSYGLDGAGQWKYFATPTPGLANGTTSIAGVIPKLKPSVKRGTFETAFTLAITNEVPDVTIRYTLDGSEPTASAPNVYVGPLTISKTTVLRAAGFKANYLPSETMTESYIFLDQVITQSNNPEGFPVGATLWGGYPTDYEMDPEITTAPEYRDLIKPALQALPIISLTISPYDMWDSANGIYTHPLSRGPAWERPCSMEFMTQDGKGFQIEAGLQIQGNAAREPVKNPKHPMRVSFKGDYGPSKLNFQMFPDSPLAEFDTLVLRADFNNGWLHWDEAQRVRGQRIRDSWMKDSMRAMGDLASHNRYTHLFINGVYWGIYDPSERPDAAFAAGYLGGSKSDWDVVNEGAAVDGTMTAYNAMVAIASPADITQYNLMKTYLDVRQYIDYMLLHFYVGHEDWGLNKNWYTMRPKDGSAGFKYVPWDGENILGVDTFNRVSNTDVPSGLHTKLLASAEYKLEFADRVQKHFFNGGALTPAQSIARWQNRSREVLLPIIAESARWGDYRRDVQQYQVGPYELYTRNVQWAAEQARLTNTYFPNRTATVLSQLRAAGLYPSVNAPVFNQNGGQINTNFQLTISGTSTIYYTTNGVDPRVYGAGTVAADAKAYGGPVTLARSAVVKARTLSGTTWSALSEAAFSTESPRVPLRFTEIMYNPDPPGDAYEYLEMQNVGALPLDVSGWYITGVDYIFPPQTVLAPGQIVLLGSSQNAASFNARYPGVTPFGYFGGQLVNSGERIAIVRPDVRTVTSVPYDDEAGWPVAADGAGYSLEVIDPLADPMDPANWRASAALKGTPGAVNPVSPRFGLAAISEIYSTSSDQSDFIEIRSMTTNDVNIGGWTVWKVGNPSKFVFPLDTLLPAQSRVVVQCDKLTNAPGFHAAFALDRDGDTIVLFDGRGGRVDARTVGPQADGYSSGLVNLQWSLCQPTPGGENVAVTHFAQASALVVNEWMSNPVSGEDDWFEIHNSDANLPVDLHGLFMGVTNQMCEILLPTFIAPGGFAKFKANERSGGVDFKLPAEGETIKIYSAGGAVIQQVTYAAQTEGVSSGRYPDGTANIIDFPFSTPGEENTLSFPITFTVSGNVLRLSWPSVAGTSFEIQSASELVSSASWQPTGQVTAGATAPIFDITIDSSNRYFRVVRLP